MEVLLQVELTRFQNYSNALHSGKRDEVVDALAVCHHRYLERFDSFFLMILLCIAVFPRGCESVI